MISQPIPHPREIAPAVPLDLANLAMRMLARDLSARFPSAHDALDAVLRCSCVTPRGALDLRELLASRFPARVPPRRISLPRERGRGGAGAATLPASPGAVRQTMGLASASPGPASPGLASAATAPGPASAGLESTVTAPGIASSGTTDRRPRQSRARRPSLVGETPEPAGSAGGPRPSGRTVAIVVVAVVVSMVAIGAALNVRSRGGGAGNAPAPRADASFSAPAIDSAVAAESSALDSAPSSPPDAAVDATVSPAKRSTPKPSPTKPPHIRPPSPSPSNANDPPGTLWLRVEPWALITVDGKSYGMTPKKIRLPPGSHRVVLENSGADKKETLNVDIESGRTREIKRKWR